LAEEITHLITQLGFGGVLGFIVGYAFKKLMKLFLVFLGLYFISLMYLAYNGFITIHYEKFSKAFEGLSSLAQGGFTLPSFLTANIPMVGGFVVGLGLGFKMG